MATVQVDVPCEAMAASVERAIEIIGEAPNKVSGDFRELHPEIPWRGIIGQRRVVAHDYGRIDHARIWDVITIHIPALAAQLTPLIPSPPASGE